VLAVLVASEPVRTLSPMSGATKWVLICAGVVPAVYLVDRLLLKLEEWGWIFYRRNKPNFRNAGSAFIELQAMFEPRVRHVLDKKEQEETEADEDHSGGPPIP
jgi:hypothetical protein